MQTHMIINLKIEQKRRALNMKTLFDPDQTFCTQVYKNNFSHRSLPKKSL